MPFKSLLPQEISEMESILEQIAAFRAVVTAYTENCTDIIPEESAPPHLQEIAHILAAKVHTNEEYRELRNSYQNKERSNPSGQDKIARILAEAIAELEQKKSGRNAGKNHTDAISAIPEGPKMAFMLIRRTIMLQEDAMGCMDRLEKFFQEKIDSYKELLEK